MIHFDAFHPIKLTTFPTPLQKVSHFSHQIGHPSVYLKRDDLFELGTGGNKIRSLEFWLGEAVHQHADVVLVSGLPASNLCRLTAAACAKLGIECHIIHNAEQKDQPAVPTGNPLLNHLLGAKILYCGNVDEHKRSAFVNQYTQQLKSGGRTPYIIGNQVLGALGYILAAQELVLQAKDNQVDLKHLFISASAGPTEVGLIFGLCLLEQPIVVHLISVEYDRDTFFEILHRLFDQISLATGLTPKYRPEDLVVFYSDYLGEGYAKPTPESLEAVKTLAQTEGIFIDTTYNAKVFAGCIDLVRKQSIPSDEAICIWHTGGTAALFDQGKYFF